MSSETTSTPGRAGGRDLTTGSIPRLLLTFSLPMLAGNLLQAAYSFVNAIWVGKFLGTTAMAAVTVSFPVLFVLMAVAGGLTMASNILVAQHSGARDMVQVRRVVQSSTLLVILVSVVLMIIGEIVTPALLGVMHTPADVMAPSVAYMRLLLLTTPFSFMVFMLASLLRGVGDSTTPLRFQVVSVVLTAVLDPLLMFGWLGLPKLGLNGTAVATIFAQMVAFAAIAWHLHHTRHLVAPAWRRLSVDLETWWQTFVIGFPAMMQQALVSIGMLFVIGIVNNFGETATAAFGAASRIDQLAFLPAMTVGMAVSSVAGQNIGAGRLHRIPGTFWWAALLGGGFTALASLAAVLFPEQLLRLFATDPQVIHLGAGYLRVVGACYMIFAFFFTSNGVINGAGHTFYTTIISLVSLWAVRVPLAAYLSGHMKRVEGVWYAMAISFGISLLLSLGYYFGGFWKRSLVRTKATETSDGVTDEQTPAPVAAGILDTMAEMD